MESLASRTMQRFEELGRISEESMWLTRMYGSPALRRAQDLVAGWMQHAGMHTWRDSVGNLIGRLEGLDQAQTLVFGGHLDTVRNAGKFDGTLGVLSGLAVVESLDGVPPISIEVVAFADEESLRFPTMYLGSTVYTSHFDPDLLTGVDALGTSLELAVSEFGGDPVALRDLPAPRTDIRAFVELHIEQGPVLDSEHFPIGVVTSIAGASRFQIDLTGEAGHAGTVPMALRRDALVAASACVLEITGIAQRTDGLVATIGSMVVEPGAKNVIPGHVVFSLDVRHANDEMRLAAVEQIRDVLITQSARHSVDIVITELPGADAVQMDPELVDTWNSIIEQELGRSRQLVSGAGHDAVSLSRIAPVSMLFLRCKDGVSHNPAESIEEADVEIGIHILRQLVDHLPQK